MSHNERLLFNLVVLPTIAIVIFLDENVGYPKVVMYYEIGFLSLIAFFFDAFDYNLKLSNFLARKAIEANQGRIHRLEEFKSRFFTNLTHELRTPLTVISGMAEAIGEQPKRWSQEGSAVIQCNAGNLLNLVNQILDLSKLENGSLPINMVKGDIVSFLGYIIDAFLGPAEMKKVSLHFLSDEEQIIMDYDPDKYVSILSNLIANAIRFTPEQGHVYVQIKRVLQNDQNYLQMSVKDTGKGIAEKDINHLFEIFYQASPSDHGTGTGIGLSIVNELVRLLDGEVLVNSTIGKGTTFTITLPLMSSADIVSTDLFRNKVSKMAPQFISVNDLPGEDIDDRSGNELHEVLIVEDNPDVLTFLQICLGDHFKLSIRRDGQAGFDKAIESVPDIILSDVMMPVKDGLTFCRDIRSNEFTSHIPVILLSAKTDTQSRIAGLEAGADLYITKPFDKKELLLQIRNLLDTREELQKRYADPTHAEVQVSPRRQQKEDEFIHRVRNIIYEYLDDSEFGVVELSRAIFLSRTQLHKKLKALTGLSASLYIRQLRLFSAKELLASEDINVTEVAYRGGFTDPNYFSRCFSQEFGINPSEMGDKMPFFTCFPCK